MKSEALRPNHGAALRAQAMLYVVLGVDLLSFVVYVWANTESGEGDYFDHDAFMQKFWGVGLSLGLCVVSYVISVVFFLLWFTRANANLNRLGLAIHPNTSYAAVCWFIPFANLVEPWNIYRVMADRYTRIQARFKQHAHPDAPNPLRLRRIGAWWWGSFVVITVVDGALILFSSATQLRVISTGLPPWFNILPGILAIVMIRQFSRVEQSVYKAVVSGDYARMRDLDEQKRAEEMVGKGGKPAAWYRKEEEEQAADAADPFRS